MPMEQNLPNREIIDATQDAVLNARRQCCERSGKHRS